MSGLRARIKENFIPLCCSLILALFHFATSLSNFLSSTDDLFGIVSPRNDSAFAPGSFPLAFLYLVPPSYNLLYLWIWGENALQGNLI